MWKSSEMLVSLLEDAHHNPKDQTEVPIATMHTTTSHLIHVRTYNIHLPLHP
jgi:hypothetical protein